MRRSLVLTVVLLGTLLFSSWQAAHGGALRSLMRSEMGEVPRWVGKLQKTGMMLAVTGTLWFGTASMSAIAQDEVAAEDVNAAWTEAQRGAIYDSVLYIALRNRDYDHMHHVVYVGDTLTGEPMFAGFFLLGHEMDYISLYDRDGLLVQGFSQRDIEIWKDPLDRFSEMRVFTIKDFSVRGAYEPVVPALFPVNEVGKEIVMVQYANPEAPESLENQALMERRCEIRLAHNWGKVGVGVHDCVPYEGSQSPQGPIFDPDTGSLIGFHAIKTATGRTAEGVTPEFIDFILSQQTNPTAVSSAGKLLTTWAAIKNGR